MAGVPLSFLSADNLWNAAGVVGAVVFYGRFYVQWIVSEFKRRSTVPVAFWYMSSMGSLTLLAYAVHLQSPLGALGQSMNIVIYTRNLIHIWREKGLLTKRRNLIVHLVVGAIAAVAIGVAGLTWLREFKISQGLETETAVRNWVWLAVGTIGQGLFACRFLVQWIVTELERKSVIPPAFWYLSVAAALLMMACFIQRGEWIFAAGMASTLLIYARNIRLIHRPPVEQSQIDQQ